ncbi:MAG: hypothetical protein RLZZ312_191 [Bacteroidota bacterium]|jgi:hypothetical protein
MRFDFLKNIAVFVLVCILMQSCSVPHFVFKNPQQVTGINFAEGSYLLGRIDVPAFSTKRIEELSLKNFEKKIGSKFSYAPIAKGVLLGQGDIALKPGVVVLKNLYKSTKFDFYINIKSKVLRSEIGYIDISPRESRNERNMNSIEMSLEIYDLKTATTLYSQTIVGIVSQNTGSSDVTFSKSHAELISAGFKRLFADLDKRSINY